MWFTPFASKKKYGTQITQEAKATLVANAARPAALLIAPVENGVQVAIVVAVVEQALGTAQQNVYYKQQHSTAK